MGQVNTSVGDEATHKLRFAPPACLKERILSVHFVDLHGLEHAQITEAARGDPLRKSTHVWHEVIVLADHPRCLVTSRGLQQSFGCSD